MSGWVASDILLPSVGAMEIERGSLSLISIGILGPIPSLGHVFYLMW